MRFDLNRNMMDNSVIIENQVPRIHWLDTAKAIGIYLVILGHLSLPRNVMDVIYSFHMPLFFFLSGITFRNRDSFGSFLKKKARSLLIPYVFFSAVIFAFWFFVGRRFGADTDQAGDAASALLQILYGINSSSYVTPLWFLTTLFVIEMALFLLLKQKRKILIVLEVSLLWILGETYYQLNQAGAVPRLFWNLDLGASYLFFITMGYLFSEKFRALAMEVPVPKKCILLVPALALFACSFWWNHESLMAACAGIFITVVVSQIIPVTKLISFFGKNTLTIFALHLMTLSVFKGVMAFVFHIDTSILENSFWINSLLAILCLLILIPVILFFRKFLPWAIGAK